MPTADEYRRRLAEAHAEALRVGDSPLRADRLADRLPALAAEAATVELPEEVRTRVAAALADAERTLRRDDDGREAARHLQSAMRLAENRARRPPPF